MRPAQLDCGHGCWLEFSDWEDAVPAGERTLARVELHAADGCPSHNPEPSALSITTPRQHGLSTLLSALSDWEHPPRLPPTTYPTWARSVTWSCVVN